MSSLTALALAGAAQATVVVGGFGGSRTLVGDTYSIYNASSGARTELTNVANQALYGDTISFAASTTTATPAYLSGVDIFFTGLISFNANALSAAEVTALSSFIAGGGVVVAHGDNTAFSATVDALLNVYGLDVDNGANNGSDTVTPTNASHPVMSGPFGVVAAHTVQDSAFLSAIDASLGGSLIASYSVSGRGAIGVVNPGAGRAGALLFLPDSETYGLAESNFRNQVEAKRVFNNGIAWAVTVANAPHSVPEPGTLALLGVGLVAALGWRRRRA